jgi:Xaa-Pro aminopeptidase
LEPGMIQSNEPGVYEEGKFGIRHENEMAVRLDEKNKYGQFLSFENLTWAPFDLEGIDASLLDKDDIDQLNAYHAKVYEKLSPFMNDEEAVWLKSVCRPL